MKYLEMHGITLTFPGVDESNHMNLGEEWDAIVHLNYALRGEFCTWYVDRLRCLSTVLGDAQTGLPCRIRSHDLAGVDTRASFDSGWSVTEGTEARVWGSFQDSATFMCGVSPMAGLLLRESVSCLRLDRPGQRRRMMDSV